MTRSTVCTLGILLVLSTTVLGGCAGVEPDAPPTITPSAPQALTATSRSGDGASADGLASAKKKPVTFTCQMTCYYNQWECQNSCEGSDGTWCISHTYWQGDGWGAWSPYACVAQ